MLLIDASQISEGGGLVLLQLLCKELQDNKHPFLLIKDHRYEGKDLDVYPHYCNPEILKQRARVYKELVATHQPDTVLCFFSIPPPVDLQKQGIRVITYFHAPNLLNTALLEGYSLKYKVLRLAKRQYLRYYKNNSTYYVFQTENMRQKFAADYGLKPGQGVLFPYYDEARLQALANEIQEEQLEETFDFCYISFPAPHKNHLRLLDAWALLADKGLYPSLVLTAPEGLGLNLVSERAAALKKKGLQINNVGKVPFPEALRYTARSRFVIYPSVNETLGLGYVEGCLLDKPILAADLPIAYDVIEPSDVFDPYDVQAIAEKVEKALTASPGKATLKLKNKLSDFIEFLVSV